MGSWRSGPLRGGGLCGLREERVGGCERSTGLVPAAAAPGLHLLPLEEGSCETPPSLPPVVMCSQPSELQQQHFSLRRGSDVRLGEF